MGNSIFRDIRYFEIKPDNYFGNFDGILGKAYKGSFEINCIGQRIARKLNEFKFISDDFDHLYIYLIDKLDNGIISEQSSEYDKQIKCFHFGQNQLEYNNLTELEREKLILEISFKVLNFKFGQDKNCKTIIDNVEQMILSQGRKLLINYKDKETKDYKINIGFQIAPFDNVSKIVIDFLKKQTNDRLSFTIDLKHYEDIYYLVDKIMFDGTNLTLQPKKTIRAEFVLEKYLQPLSVKIN